jgi:hypothetical protein
MHSNTLSFVFFLLQNLAFDGNFVVQPSSRRGSSPNDHPHNR